MEWQKKPRMRFKGAKNKLFSKVKEGSGLEKDIIRHLALLILFQTV
jgi:uncharacterized protein YjbJ (UPF0337 family)